MAYGINVKNTSSEIQIDQDFTNFVFHSEGDITVPARSPQGSYYVAGSATITAAGADDITFFKGTSIFGYGNVIRSAHTASQTVYWKRYRKANTAVTLGTGYGIEVRNSTGTQAAFSSNYNPMKVAFAGTIAVSTTTQSNLAGNYVALYPCTRPYKFTRQTISSGFARFPIVTTSTSTFNWTRDSHQEFYVPPVSRTNTKNWYFLSILA